MDIIPATTPDHLAEVRALFREYERFLDLNRHRRREERP
jgi:hypothetical protein